MPLLNYTTSIQAAKTVSEIQSILSAHGARSVIIDYGEDGLIEALSFVVLTPQSELNIRLPIDSQATFRVLERQAGSGKIPYRFVTRDQAVRVAWRIIKDWTEAQMAILETEMVRMEQIFLPYMVTRNGQTLFEKLESKQFQFGELPEGRG